MILVDTSVWIDFFQGKERAKILTQLLLDNRVIMHPYILAELTLGGLNHTTKNLINCLDFCKIYDIQLIFNFIEEKKIIGKGIGFVDTTLIFTCTMESLELFTYDNKLLMLQQYFENNYFNTG